MAKMFLEQTGLAYLIGRIWQHVASAVGGKADTTSIGNGTLTITQDGVTVATFTANQSGNTTAALTSGGSSSPALMSKTEYTPGNNNAGTWYSSPNKHVIVHAAYNCMVSIYTAGYYAVTNDGTMTVQVKNMAGTRSSYPGGPTSSSTGVNDSWPGSDLYVKANQTAFFMATTYGIFLLGMADPEAGA